MIKKFQDIRIGTSGYNYNHWRSVFYPANVAQNQWLEYYAKFFNTVELNVTFYRLPSVELFEKWREETPDDFIFVIKGSRLITHYKKLKDIEESLSNFIENASNLKQKLACVLWQLPSNFEYDSKRFAEFCEQLKKYSEVKFAFEFRNNSWFNVEVYQTVKSIGGSVVLADWPFTMANWKSSEAEVIIPEFDFVYLRRHGSQKLYSSAYSKAELESDAANIKRWINQDKCIFAFFNNDAQGNAVKNALELKKLIAKTSQ